MPEQKRNGGESASEPISERMRLIRFRMTREHARFSDELRLIPRKLILVTAALFLLAEGVTQVVIHYAESPWPEYSHQLNHLIAAGICAAASIPIAALIFLIGYVYRDASRRRMNATLWTILVIVLLPAWLGLGFIIYFLMREPLPYPCPQCGAEVSARFNYCPACKFNLRPTCPKCGRAVATGNRFCPHCASELAEDPASAMPADL